MVDFTRTILATASTTFELDHQQQIHRSPQQHQQLREPQQQLLLENQPFTENSDSTLSGQQDYSYKTDFTQNNHQSSGTEKKEFFLRLISKVNNSSVQSNNNNYISNSSKEQRICDESSDIVEAEEKEITQILNNPTPPVVSSLNHYNIKKENTPITSSAASHLNRKQLEGVATLFSSTTDNETSHITTNDLGYQLRALTSDNISSPIDLDNPWSIKINETFPASNRDISTTLSSELVNETLNYFVNCKQRSSQMNKTYDDNDAYIYLLQEKEVDLELAARIGQELLKQNKQLKENIKELEQQLVRRHDEIQQLKYDLNSKITLLDTFIDEEEQQHQQDKQQQEDHQEPTSSNYFRFNSPASGYDSEDVSLQFLENNKRLCELQDELYQKNEQNLLHKENILKLQHQIKETDRRLCDVLSENDSLQKSMNDILDGSDDLYRELKETKRNFTQLLSVFLEMQKECISYRKKVMQYEENFTNNNKDNDLKDLLDTNENSSNISFEYYNGYTSAETKPDDNKEDPKINKRNWLGLSSFLLTSILLYYLSVGLAPRQNLMAASPQ